MSKLQRQLTRLSHSFFVSHPNYILLHSGYGGGQYVGRLVGVKSGSPLPVLVLTEIKRYQPLGSTMGGREWECHWQNGVPYHPCGYPGESVDIRLKEKDRLYLVGKNLYLGSFIEAKEPVDPADPDHTKRLTGKSELLDLLYEGSELVLVK